MKVINTYIVYWNGIYVEMLEVSDVNGVTGYFIRWELGQRIQLITKDEANAIKKKNTF